MDWKKKEYWIAILLLGLTGIYTSTLRFSKPTMSAQVDLENIPQQIGDWVGESYELDKRVIEILKSDQTIQRRYVNSSGAEVWLFISYFRDQKYGAQIHSPKHCLPGGGWKIKDHRRIRIKSTNAAVTEHNINQLDIENGQERQQMLYWFETRGGKICSEWMLKLDLVKNSLLNKPTDAAFVRISGNVLSTNDVSANGTAQIFDFVRALSPYLHNSLPF